MTAAATSDNTDTPSHTESGAQRETPSLSARRSSHQMRATAEVAVALNLAELAYAADADHLARTILVGLILQGAVTQDEVNAAVERGLARFRATMGLARDPGRRGG